MSHAAEVVGERRTAAFTSVAAVFVPMFGLGLGFSIRLVNTWDEAWFLQVVSRMRNGDVLYRDISYGAGPVPAYLTEAATYIVSTDILAVKLVVVGSFAAAATFAWLIASEIGIGFRGRVLLLAGIAAFGPPLQESPYALMATTCLLAAMLAALRVQRTGSTAAAIAGGLACALAFGSKQNVGLYALAALLLSALLGRRLAAAAWSLGSCAFATCLLLMPVALTGGLHGYIEYGFAGKGAYLRAPDPFRSTLVSVGESLSRIHSLDSAETAYWAVGFFLPFLAVIALPFVRRAPARIVIALFAAASFATLFPRFDAAHVAAVAAPLLVLVAYALNEAREHLPAPLGIAIAAWVGIAVLLMATLPFRLARSPSAALSELPHLHGTFVEQNLEDQWQAEASRLRRAAAGRESTLLLTPDAGFRYLTSGLQNPTAFDFPFATTFGSSGQQQVIDSIRQGRIRQVCVARDWWGLEPSRLVLFVRSSMQAVADLGFCRMYRA